MFELRRLFSSRRRSRRNRHSQPSIAAIQQTQVLESRALLTMAIQFDMSLIGSDVSDTLRHHGSTDPADAPFETLNYLAGTATGFSGFDGGDMLANPGDLTFEAGSMDVSNPIRIAELDTFDDGVMDDVANASYKFIGDGENSEVNFFYKGEQFGISYLSTLRLDTYSDGTTTGLLALGTVYARGDASVEFQFLADFLTHSFETHYSLFSQAEYGLGTFDDGVAWPGSEDGKIYQTPGNLSSPDSASGVKEFARHWDTTAPLTIDFSYLYDWFKADLDQSREYSIRVGGEAQISRVWVEDADGNQITAEYNANPAEVTFIPTTPTTFLKILQYGPGAYTLEVLSATPQSLAVAADGTDITWSAEYDSNGAEIPAEGYRVIVRSADELVYQQDVDGNTRSLSLDGHLGLSQNEVTVSRLAAGEVAATGAVRLLDGVRLRPNITGFDSATNVLSWDAIPGATGYSVYLGPGNIVSTTETSMTLPNTLGTTWKVLWVRGSGQSTNGVTWSAAFNYHPRNAVTNIQVNTDNPTRPGLTWAPMETDTFEVFVNNVTTGQPGVIRESGITETAWSASSDLGVGTYRVWVRARSAAGYTGHWSETATFNVGPKPVSITEGSSTLRPVFTWSDVPGVESVDLYIYNGGSATVVNGLTGTTYESPNDLAAGVIRWWVRGNAAGGIQTRWSDAHAASVAGGVLLSGPSGLIESRAYPTISWGPALGAERYEVLVVGKDTGTQTHVTTNTTHQLFLPGDRYKVWVNTIYPSGENFWSNRLDFDVKTSGERVIVTPSGTVATATPTLEWLPSGYFYDRYATAIWVQNLDTGENLPIVFTDPSVTSYTFTEPLAPGSYKIWMRHEQGRRWSKSITLTITGDGS